VFFEYVFGPGQKLLTGYDLAAEANAQGGLVLNSRYGKPVLLQNARALRLAVKFTSRRSFTFYQRGPVFDRPSLFSTFPPPEAFRLLPLDRCR